MGIPDEPFWAPEQVVQEYRSHVRTRAAAARGASRRQADDGMRADPPPGWQDLLPRFDGDTNLATRQAFQKALEASKDVLPWVLSGAADLTGNTGAKIDGKNPFSRTNPGGRQVYYGIREHAMGAALVGMALHGGLLPVGGTFFVFADYMRPAIRLAALSRAKCVFVFSHDSVGVGEDGPTHQPVEQLASLRAMPGLRVIRPADPNETVAAWRTAVDSEGPTVLVLSRQNVDSVTDGSAVRTGAATIRERNGARAVIVATGSEVGLAVRAAERLESEGLPVNVVSMPSWDIFESQSRSYKESVFPPGVPVVSVEAGTTFGWDRWADVPLGIDRFGASAPGGRVLEELGMNVEAVTAAVRSATSR
jgi:transketolase